MNGDANVGRFTFRNNSVIDNAIASAECFEFISDFDIIETDPLFSDGHANVLFVLPTVKYLMQLTKLLNQKLTINPDGTKTCAMLSLII